MRSVVFRKRLYNLVKESGSSELREMPDYLNQDRPSFEARA